VAIAIAAAQHHTDSIRGLDRLAERRRIGARGRRLDRGPVRIEARHDVVFASPQPPGLAIARYDQSISSIFAFDGIAVAVAGLGADGGYWISWNGDTTGAEDFKPRNFMAGATMLGYGHALDTYTADLAPPGGSHFNVPFADPRTAAHVAAKVDAVYAAGKDNSLAIADGPYANSDPADKAFAGRYDL
jgi:hypothetical protein